MSDDTADSVPERTATGHAGSPSAGSPPEHVAPGDGGDGSGQAVASGPGASAGVPVGTGENGLTYERARAELEDVVRRLEVGGTTLEEALALWERGEDLARTCQDFLDGARARLDARRARQHPAG